MKGSMILEDISLCSSSLQQLDCKNVDKQKTSVEMIELDFLSNMSSFNSKHSNEVLDFDQLDDAYSFKSLDVRSLKSIEFTSQLSFDCLRTHTF